MINETIIVTLIAIVLTMVVRGGTAVGLLVATAMVWPDYLRIPMGLAQMSAARLVAIVLLVRFTLGRDRQLFRWRRVDSMVVLGWLWTVACNVIEDSLPTTVNEMIGRGFDTVLMYFVARLGLVSTARLKETVVPIAVAAVVMCFFGWAEAVWEWSPFESCFQFCPSAFNFVKDLEYRLGLLRAKTSMGHAIYFGMAMFMVLAWLWSMRGLVRSRSLVRLGSFAALLASFFSLSSGPQLALVILLICSSFYLRPRLIRPSLWALAVLCVFVEFLSNRHFYQLIDYLALSGDTAWYRSRLLEVAVERVDDYWLFGKGGRDLNFWGMLVDGRRHLDVVNHFIVIAHDGGLGTLALYVGSHVIAIRDSIAAYRTSRDVGVRKFAFGMVCGMIALDASSMSVGLYGPPLVLSYLLLGMMVDAQHRLVACVRPAAAGPANPPRRGARPSEERTRRLPRPSGHA